MSKNIYICIYIRVYKIYYIFTNFLETKLKNMYNNFHDRDIDLFGVDFHIFYSFYLN